MAWLTAAALEITELRLKADCSMLWMGFEKQVNSAQPMVFKMDRKAERIQRGQNVLGGIANSMFSSDGIWKAAGVREEFPLMGTSVLGSILSSGFSGEEDLIGRGNPKFWNATFNCDVPNAD